RLQPPEAIATLDAHAPPGSGRIDQLSGGLCHASDLKAVHERLAPYVAAGLRALCARAGPPPRPGKRVERRAQARGAAPDRAPRR
ncbi:MAG TPA: hypothetical protein VF764_09670, partial [Steroidobacteraceae bacterium]